VPVLDNYLSIVEAAEVLGIHPGTVKRLCREGKLPAKKVHNAWLISTDALQVFSKDYKGLRGRPRAGTK